MTLNKRLLLIIIPLLFAGVTVGAYGVYQAQSKALTEIELGKLENRLRGLHRIYEQEVALSNGVLSILVEGQTLVDYVANAGNEVRGYIASQRMDRIIDRVLTVPDAHIVVSLIDYAGKLMYHYERSDNPFADLPPFMAPFVDAQFNKSQIDERKLMFLNGGRHAYIQSKLVNKYSLAEPLVIDVRDSVALSVVSYTEGFDRALHELEQDYGVPAQIVHRSHNLDTSPGGQRVSLQLMPNTYLEVALSESYMAGVMKPMLIWLSIVSAVFGVVVSGALLLIIRRYITSPVQQLDQQLQFVMTNRQTNILRPIGQDEISRLGVKFYDLYDQLNANLRESNTMAVTDALTKLPNRTRFHDYARKALMRASVNGGYVSLIYIDLDNFKFVNDRMGHEAGDELLQEAGQAFLGLLKDEGKRRTGSMASRLSGDEFAIVLSHEHLHDREQVASNLIALFDGGFKTERYITPVSASVGVATYPEDGSELRELIANADMAMYHAKRSGKNRFDLYSYSIAREARRVKLIEDALKFVDCDEEFSLVYMPYMDRNHEIKGVEVLLRWCSPVLGQIQPDEFVPIAEQTGSYGKIDNWVFRKAFTEYANLQAIVGTDATIAINISAAELGQKEFSQNLIALKEEMSIPDGKVELEITETFGYFAVEQVLDVLRLLRDSGFRIAIDDFGIGYTPLLQMIDYPVDKVKLDKELVTRVTDARYQQLLAPTIELCHLQKIKVTAEGVESLSQVDVLAEAGCDFFQGYSIATPMPMSALRRWFTSYVPRNK